MTIISMIGLFLFALILTLIIELLVVYIFGYRKKNMFYVVLLANLITNPALNLIIAIFARRIYGFQLYLVIGLLELAVVYVEYVILIYVFEKKYQKQQLFILALVMNASSFLIGEVVKKLIRNIYMIITW